jgi:hypothetical protein
MKFIHFSILDKTLCGAEEELVPEHLVETRRFCNDCVQVMWKEQYKRRILSPQLKKTKLPPIKRELIELSQPPTSRFKPLIKYMKVTA